MYTAYGEGQALTSGPSNLCGSLRVHDAHARRGQSTGVLLQCPGADRPQRHMCASDDPPAHHGKRRMAATASKNLRIAMTAEPTLPGMDTRHVAPYAEAATQEDFIRVGLTYRQLDHWTTRGYLKAVQDHPGSGYGRRWPRGELGVARDMRRLCNQGLQVWAAHYVARALRELPSGDRIPLGEGVFIEVR